MECVFAHACVHGCVCMGVCAWVCVHGCVCVRGCGCVCVCVCVCGVGLSNNVTIKDHVINNN